MPQPLLPSATFDVIVWPSVGGVDTRALVATGDVAIDEVLFTWACEGGHRNALGSVVVRHVAHQRVAHRRAFQRDGGTGRLTRVIRLGGGHGLEIVSSHGNTVERNTFAAASDGGVVLLGSAATVLSCTTAPVPS
jgi:hypothetical protein